LVSDLLSHLVEKVVCRWLNCPNNSASKCVGEGPAHEQFRRGPQPVKGANLVGIESPQGGHLGRWSGAAKRRVLTLRNFCGRQVSMTGAPMTIQCLPIWIGGFQDQACLALFVWSSGPSGLWRPWSPLKGDLGRPLFLPRFFLLILESLGSADFGRRSDYSANLRVFVWRRAHTPTCGWGVWQVAPVFPSCGGPLALSESSFSAPYSSGRGDLSGEFPLSGEVFPSDMACYA
jgi:hypothetical protein